MHIFSNLFRSCTAYLWQNIRQIASCFLLLAIVNSASAQSTIIDPQNGTDPLLKPVPHAPDESSLFKFTEIPVSQSTGVPDVSIPIYQITMKGVSIPIRLRYHSGGIGITETASSVGMGWALDCGGILSQTIKGIDDFHPLYSRFYKPSKMALPSNCDVKAAAEHQQDSEPDIFSFSFGGYTGSFYLDSLGRPVQINEQKIKIESITVGSNSIFPTAGWKLTDLNGIQYFFALVTYTTSRSMDYTVSSAPDPKSATTSSKTWYLTKILDQGGDSTILKYDTTTTIQNTHTGDSQYTDYTDASIGGGNCPPMQPGLHRFFVNQISVRLRLRSIQFPNGYVQFTEGGNRCDLYGDTYLGKIAVYNNQNVKINEYDMRYKYMIGNQWYDPSNVDCSSDNTALSQDPQFPTMNAPYNKMDTRRLFLTEVDQIDQNNAINDSYKMTYENSLGMPGRFSAQQDFWGYYNGNGYSSLLQNYTAVTGSPFPPTYTISGRSPILNYAKQGILTQMIYPTGGYSNFDYELNVRAVPTLPTTSFPAGNYTVTSGQTSVSLSNFTVNDISGHVYYTVTINGCTFGAGAVTSGYSIVNSQTGAVVVPEQHYSGTTTTTYTLSNGSYTLKSGSSFSGCNYTINTAAWTEHQNHTYVYVNQNYGGLRVKDIQTYDPVSQNTMVKSYKYVLPSGLSSMSLFSFPVDSDYQTREVYELNNPGSTQLAGTIEFDGVECGGYYTKLNSSSHYVLPTAQNGLFGYTYVTEKDTTTAGSTPVDNGYTVYQFQSSGVGKTYSSYMFVEGYSAPTNTENRIPEVVIDNSWSRDKLLFKDIYKRNPDNTYNHIESEKYFYSIHNTALGNGYTVQYKDRTVDANSYNSAYAQLNPSANCSNGNNLIIGVTDIIEYVPYQIYSGYQVLDSTFVQKIYDNQSAVSSTTYYTYNANNLLPKVIRTADSKDGNIIINRSYPLDYNLSGTPNNNVSLGIKTLQSNYVITPVIEQYIQRSNSDGTNLRTVQATLISYKPTIPFPDTIYRAAITQPISVFSPAAITASAVIKSNRYEPIASFNKYDANGNILEQQKIGGSKEVYLWGYHHQYPVAKIVGSDYTTVTSVVTQAQIDAAVTSGDTAVRTLLNALRSDSRTSGAMTATYTYNPLIGMTSSTDTKGLITYYEYDWMERLMNIRDKDKNIVKSFCYNYAGQQTTNCYINLPSFTNARKDSVFYTSCGSNYTSSAVVYTVPAGTYTSNISQADADNQATNDAIANGQRYANLHGSCTANTSFVLTNNTGAGYQINFTGPFNLTFNFSNSGSQTIQVPVGTYSIAIYPTGAYVNHTISLTGQPTQYNTPRYTFTNVTLSTSTTLTALVY